jgi:hypothetical protein
MAKGRKTGGRAKGTPNKVTGDLRAMILGALDAAGGQKYLQTQARENPQAFLALVGRTLPKEIKAELTAGTLRVVLDGQGVRDA